jgi:hypothetical protein
MFSDDPTPTSIAAVVFVPLVIAENAEEPDAMQLDVSGFSHAN